MRGPTLLLALLLSLGARAEDGGPTEDARVVRPAFAGQPDVIARLEPERVHLAETFELVIEVRRPDGTRIQLPDPLDPGALELVGEVKRSQRQAEGHVVETLRVPLAAFALDDVETPALTLRLADGELLEVPPLPVQVLRSLDAEAAGQGLAEAATPLALERFDSRPVAVLAALGIFALLLAGFSWMNRRRGRPAIVAPPAPPPRPADEVALEKLDALARSPWIRARELERFVDAAVAVLREYLGTRYRLAALDMTSGELLTALEGVLDARLEVAEIGAILDSADLVKFARASTTAQACAGLIESIRKLVLATRTRRAPDAEEDAA